MQLTPDQTPASTLAPEVYRAEYAPQAQRLSQLGLDDEELAFVFGVARGTIDRWRREHPEFHHGIEIGLLDLVSTVERETIRSITGRTAKRQRVLRGKIIELERWVPGNAYAGMEWLSRRCPDRLSP